MSPDKSKMLITATCVDVYRSGVYVAASDGSGLRQLLTGHAAAPAWSPDGRWISFGYYPLGGTVDQVALWIARSDGTAAHQITDAWASWPAWQS